MNSKRSGVEKNAMTDKLYMMRGFKTVFHQLMPETGTMKSLRKKKLFTIS